MSDDAAQLRQCAHGLGSGWDTDVRISAFPLPATIFSVSLGNGL